MAHVTRRGFSARSRLGTLIDMDQLVRLFSGAAGFVPRRGVESLVQANVPDVGQHVPG